MLKGKVHKYGADVNTDVIILGLLDRVQRGLKGGKPL